jgi:hypothetical protein
VGLPSDVLDRLAHLQRREVVGALADGLDDQGDRAGLLVHVGDGERDALRPGSAPDDDELPGLADLGDAGCLYDEAGDVGGELVSGDDGVHLAPAGLRGGSPLQC